MGGRGMSMFSTAWTKRQKERRLATLDAEIAEIDSKAKAVGEEEYKYYMSHHNTGPYKTLENLMSEANEARRWAILEYQSEHSRGPLVAERRKIRQELAAIKDGQKTLFG